MRCLVAVDDTSTRDAVGTAVRAFQDVETDVVDLEQGRQLLRRRRYDLAFTTLRSESQESKKLWEALLAVTPRVELVGLTPRSGLSVHRADRSRLHLSALLGTPLDAVELYGTLRRLLDRLRKPQPSTGGRPV